MRKGRMSDSVSEVTIRLPGRDEKGFLRRLREVHAILDENPDPHAMWGKVSAYLIEHGYVQAPEGVDLSQAVEELSQSDLQRIVGALLGLKVEDEAKVVNPPSDA